MMKITIVVFLWGVCSLTHGTEVAITNVLTEAATNQSAEAKLYEASQIYTRTSVSDAERKDWTAKWISRIQDALRGEVTEDAFVRDFAFNWCCDHKGEFKKPETAKRENVIFLTMMYVYVYDKNIGLPTKVKDKLTPEVVDRVVDFLTTKAPKLIEK